MQSNTGRLVCVGPGMTLGAHMSPRCRSHIENADVVFTSCHPIMENWLATMNADTRSLQSLYAEGKDRRITYHEMVKLIMGEVRSGKSVVGAFYGHPGVFAQVPHAAIAQAREEGFTAHMEPGISAEDCLYADMGIDPGAFGSQHFEASQLMMFERVIDSSAYLFLWQIALAGDLSIAARASSQEQRQVLVDMMTQHYGYPPEHAVALYECPTLITDKTRIEWIPLHRLPDAELTLVTTLVVPPCKKLIKNSLVIDKLQKLQQQQGSTHD